MTEDSAVILWQAPRAKITGYRLFLIVEGSNPKQLRLPARLSQYTILNLRPETGYTVTLHAEQDNTLSEGATGAFTTSECLMHKQAYGSLEILSMSSKLTEQIVVLSFPNGQRS